MVDASPTDIRARKRDIVALRHALGLLAAVIGTGTIGFMLTEGWGAWDALFFTLVTITTVGYGDYGVSETGERLTAVLMLVGIGTLTYAAGQVINVIVRRQLDRSAQMRKQIAKLNGHFIVCGLGSIGMTVCERLAAEDIPFVAMDCKQASADTAADHGWLAMSACGTDERNLIAAGLDRARGVVVLSSSDTDNIVITLTARHARQDVDIIARAEREESIPKMQHAGATRVIAPARVGGLRIADALITPSLVDLFDIGPASNQDVRLAEVAVAEGSPLAGVPICEWGPAHPRVSVVAIRHAAGNAEIRPSAGTVLLPGDTVIVAGTSCGIDGLANATATRRAAA